MSQARLTSVLCGCALALFFFFGNLAPGLAHETIPGSSVSVLRVDFVVSGPVLRGAAQVSHFGLDGEIGDVVTPLPKVPAAVRMLEKPPERRLGKPLAGAGFHGPKVSRHLLDSILLI